MRRRVLAWILIFAFILSGCGKSAGAGSSNEAGPEFRGGLEEYADVTEGQLSSEEQLSREGQLFSEEQLSFAEREYTVPEINPVNNEHTVTLMIYMVGSDLEAKGGAATNDMAEMMASGVDLNKVNLLIYAGGSSKWFSDFSATENSIYQLTDTGFKQVESFAQRSMGEPECLSEFLNYSYNNYPADSYNLIFWNHGNGPVMGYGKDKLFDGDSLTLPELRVALDDSPFGTDNKLGFVGFDACLMASAELACILSDYAKLMVSSQEVEPNFGWNYAFLDKCGYMDETSLAKYIVVNFVNYCELYFAEHENFCADITLSVVDLQYAGELEVSIDALFEQAIDDVTGGYSKLAIERYNTKALGRATSGSEYDLVDVANLMQTMSENYPEATRAVQKILDKMVIADGYNADDCCGMSLYYPYFNKKHYTESWKETYSQIGLFESYLNYLGRYEQVWLGTEMSEFFMEPMTPEEFTPGVYSLILNDEQIEHYLDAGFHILKKIGEDVYCSVSYSQDVDLNRKTLTANYDGKTVMVTDDYGNKKIVPTTVTDVHGDKYYHTLNFKASNRFYTDSIVVDSSAMTVAAEAQMVVDHINNQVEIEGYYLSDISEEISTDISEGGLEGDSQEDYDEYIQSGKKFPLDTDVFTTFSLASLIPRYPTRDDNGILLPYDEWTKVGMTFFENISVENGVHFTYEPFYADGSEYFLMFDVIDTQNNHYSSELMPIVLAQSPVEEEKEFPVTEYEWEEGKLSPEIENYGVAIQVFEALDPQILGHKIYGLYVTNTNEFPVMIDLSNICLNGEYHISNIPSERVPSQGASVILMNKVESSLRMGGYDSLGSIRFTYDLINGFTGKYLISRDDIQVNISGEIAPRVTCVPALKALAGKQVLVDNDDYRVELMDCGNYLGTSSNSTTMLQARIKAINKSDLSRTYEITGIYVNGFYFDTNAKLSVYGEGEGNKFINFENLGSGYLIDEIYSVVLEWKVSEAVSGDSEYISTPIKLDFAGKKEEIDLNLLGCIYEDENLKVYDGGLTGDGYYSEDPHMRAFIICNVSGQDLYYDISQLNPDTGENNNLYFGGPFLIKNNDMVMRSIGDIFGVHSIREKKTLVVTVYDEDTNSFIGGYIERYTTPEFDLNALEEDE